MTVLAKQCSILIYGAALDCVAGWITPD